MSQFNKAFILVDPKVLSIEAHAEREMEDHLQWHCSYSREDVISEARVVIGTLHGATKEAGFTVTMGSLFIETGTTDTSSDYQFAVRESEALETLYDLCRQQAAIVVGMLGLNEKFDVPWKAPDPEISVLEERELGPDQAETSESSENIDGDCEADSPS